MPNIEDIIPQISVTILEDKKLSLLLSSGKMTHAFERNLFGPNTAEKCIFTMIVSLP